MAAPESLTQGVVDERPGVHKWLGGCAAPGNDFAVLQHAALESLTRGVVDDRPGLRSRLGGRTAPGNDFFVHLHKR